MSSQTFLTPLRYPGGKGRLGPWLGELMRHNRISGGWYVEPYAGGAGAALYLLVSGYVDHIVINDLDPVVHAFWWAALNQNEELLDKIAETDVTMDEWERQKEVHKAPEAYSPLDVSFATFFLNRTNRSGILKGGVIGGKKQTGNYKLDARYNKPDLIQRLERIGKYRKRISLYNKDAVQLLKDLNGDLPQKTLINLDPPYYQKGSQLYRNHYNHDDHQIIADVIQKVETPWLVTYDNHEEIKKLYAESKGTEFSLCYSTHMAREKATELMFYGNLELHQEPQLTR